MTSHQGHPVARAPRRTTRSVATSVAHNAQLLSGHAAWQDWQPRLDAAITVTRQRLRDYRVGARHSQSQAADAFVRTIPPDGLGWGMRGSSISRLERQSREMGSFSLRGFLTLLRTYGIRPSRWAREIEDAMIAQGLAFLDGDVAEQPSLERLLVQAFRSLPAEIQPLAVSTVQAIAQSTVGGAMPGLAPAQTPQSALNQAMGVVDRWYDDAVTRATATTALHIG